MLKFNVLGLSFICAIVFHSSAQAKLYKWVDDKGITHYGEVIPPEYANKERDSINKSGLLDKRPEKINYESVKAKEEADAKKKQDNIAIVEQQRRDAALLNTYSNEKEIEQARERSMVLINARLDSNKMLLKSSQDSLDVLKKEFDNRTKTGKKIPVSLTNDIATAEERVLKMQAELEKNEQHLATVKARFDGETELYRKLKGTASGK